MAHDIDVGVDTSGASRRAVGCACDLASVPRPDDAAPPTTARPAPPGEGDSDPNARVLLCHVVPWSPFSFTTAEDNDACPVRREAELVAAREQVFEPLARVAAERGVTAATMARHGDPVDCSPPAPAWTTASPPSPSRRRTRSPRWSSSPCPSPAPRWR